MKTQSKKREKEKKKILAKSALLKCRRLGRTATIKILEFRFQVERTNSNTKRRKTHWILSCLRKILSTSYFNAINHSGWWLRFSSFSHFVQSLREWWYCFCCCLLIFGICLTNVQTFEWWFFDVSEQTGRFRGIG